MRRTKIVATLGPVSSDPQSLVELITAGVNVARLNYSHGTHQEHRQLALPWGVTPVLSKHYDHLEDMLSDGLGILKHRGFVDEGDIAVVIFGTTLMPGATNIMKVHNF